MKSRKKRPVIKIDEEKCDGCGLCLPGCPEGALQIIDGKARLVKESYCDGLGACLGHCPRGALTIEEREAEEYDARAVLEHLEKQSPELAEQHREHLRAHGLEEKNGNQSMQAGCPSQEVHDWQDTGKDQATSSLTNWPVKLYLMPPNAEFLKNADLMLVADCVPFACANLHRDFLPGKAVAAGCPKFDDAEAYREKIEQILESVNIRSITVVYMEISCCGGFVNIVREALHNTATDIPLHAVQIGLKGETIKEEEINA